MPADCVVVISPLFSVWLRSVLPSCHLVITGDHTPPFTQLSRGEAGYGSPVHAGGWV